MSNFEKTETERSAELGLDLLNHEKKISLNEKRCTRLNEIILTLRSITK